jgi:hypothetical protein
MAQRSHALNAVIYVLRQRILRHSDCSPAGTTCGSDSVLQGRSPHDRCPYRKSYPAGDDRESCDPGFRCGTFADCFGGRLLACFDREQRLKLRTWSSASRRRTAPRKPVFGSIDRLVFVDCRLFPIVREALEGIDVQIGRDRDDRDRRRRNDSDVTVGVGPGGVTIGPRQNCRMVTTTVERDDGRTITRKERRCD